MTGATAIPRRSFGETMRADIWWVQPLLVFLGLSVFIVYSTWAAFQGRNYFVGNYISPFYSPEIFGDSPHSWFGPKPGWWPGWLLFSPALLVLWAPAGFRVTCYYYRGAYYKAFWADPPACTVGEPRNVVLLGGYTFGCHSLRHLAGGFLDQFSKSPTCYRAYACVSCFNRRHMLWAWLSLFWVGFADLYVRLCAMGIWHDFRIF